MELRFVAHQPHLLLPAHVYNLPHRKPTLKVKTAPDFVRYLISCITAWLALTQQPRQYQESVFPESADRTQLSVSHEGSVQLTKRVWKKTPGEHCCVSVISTRRRRPRTRPGLIAVD